MARISPLAGMLDRLGGRTDERVINFSMGKARDSAWAIAQRLAKLDIEDSELEIKKIDQSVAALAHRVVSPGKFLWLIALLVRLGEIGDVRTKIQSLNQ